MVKVVERKLGQHKRGGHHIWGYADMEKKVAHIEARLPPLEKFITEGHELYHLIWNDTEEKDVWRAERFVKVLWRLGYRKVDERFR